MSKTLIEWVDSEVQPHQDKSVTWLSEVYCFRDPTRPIISDHSSFLSPADGIILYQKRVAPDQPLLEIKGRSLTVREALRNPRFEQECLVIGIFMTFFDVHINRVPYAGRLWYAAHEPLDTFNHPMLDVEKSILDDLRIDVDAMKYLHHNQRVVNRFYADELQQSYYVVQIADYDVDCITPFEMNQGRPFLQGHRFSQIRYGSQVDLIVPLSNDFEFVTIQETTSHVEAGMDPLIRITRKTCERIRNKENAHALFTTGAGNGIEAHNGNNGCNGNVGHNGHNGH